MSKRHSGQPDWVVTFADLFTLLFCFFVLLTTLSTQPKDCLKIKEYLENNKKKFLNYELRSTKLECIISLPSDYLFQSGAAEIQNRALRAIAPLFRKVKKMPEHAGDLTIVEGHTDDVPINTRRFSNNWELSSARATNVALFLVKRLGYEGDDVSIRAFAENKPKVPYVTESGKRLKGRKLREARRINRRVEIILINKPKGKSETKLLFRGEK